jgi:hypothetical protein
MHISQKMVESNGNILESFPIIMIRQDKIFWAISVSRPWCQKAASVFNPLRAEVYFCHQNQNANPVKKYW